MEGERGGNSGAWGRVGWPRRPVDMVSQWTVGPPLATAPAPCAQDRVSSVAAHFSRSSMERTSVALPAIPRWWNSASSKLRKSSVEASRKSSASCPHGHLTSAAGGPILIGSEKRPRDPVRLGSDVTDQRRAWLNQRISAARVWRHVELPPRALVVAAEGPLKGVAIGFLTTSGWVPATHVGWPWRWQYTRPLADRVYVRFDAGALPAHLKKLDDSRLTKHVTTAAAAARKGAAAQDVNAAAEAKESETTLPTRSGTGAAASPPARIGCSWRAAVAWAINALVFTIAAFWLLVHVQARDSL